MNPLNEDPTRNACTIRRNVGRKKSSFRILLVGLAALTLILLMDSSQGFAWDAKSIRGSTRRILSSREFRNLKPIKRSRGAPKFKRSDEGGPSSSSDGSASKEDGKNGEGGNQENGGKFQEGQLGEEQEFGSERDNWTPGEGEDQSLEDSDSSSESSDSSFSGGSAFGQFLGGVFQVLGWIFVAAIVCVMLFMIAQGIMSLVEWFQGRDKTIEADEASAEDVGELEPEFAPGETPADAYIAKAKQLAAEGKYRAGIGQLILGAMSNIERAGLVQFRKGLTQHDYTRAVRSHPHMFQSMKGIVQIYEPLGFGRRTPTSDHFKQSLAKYMTGFRETHPSN
ncbi:MAG: hypothetical protein Tsb009_28220 [Planctomycetaceae bacterium]